MDETKKEIEEEDRTTMYRIRLVEHTAHELPVPDKYRNVFGKT